MLYDVITMADRKESYEAAQPILEYMLDMTLYGWADRLTYRLAVGDYDRALHYCGRASAAAIARLEDLLDMDALGAGELDAELDNTERIKQLEALIQRLRHRSTVRAARQKAQRRSSSSLRPRTFPTAW